MSALEITGLRIGHLAALSRSPASISRSESDRDPRHHRPERLGQDDLVQHHRGRTQADRRARVLPGQRHHRPTRSPDRAQRIGANVPAGDVVSGTLPAREHADRQRARPLARLRRQSKMGLSRRDSRLRRSRARRRKWPARCPSATCAGSASRWPSRRSRRSCCSTSRRRLQRKRERRNCRN